MVGWLVGWFYSISTIIDYGMSGLFSYKQFYFKQLSFTLVSSLNIKTVLFQTIQFSINTVFVYTQVNVQTVSSNSI